MKAAHSRVPWKSSIIKNPPLHGLPTREMESFSPLSLGLSLIIDYDRQQLLHHEALVHSLTALNGRAQPVLTWHQYGRGKAVALTLQEMGVLAAPREGSAAPAVLAGRPCPECGNATLIHKDGCDFRTACGHIGICG